VEFLNAKPGGTYDNRWALSGFNEQTGRLVSAGLSYTHSTVWKRKICSRKFSALLGPCGKKDVEETEVTFSAKRL